MKKLPWRDIYAWLLAAFFVLGGGMNLLASPEILADYRRWGYPDWFHYVTGVMEWTAAVLIAIPATRLAGSVFAGTIMAAAAGTVALNGEFSHAKSCIHPFPTFFPNAIRRAAQKPRLTIGIKPVKPTLYPINEIRRRRRQKSNINRRLFFLRGGMCNLRFGYTSQKMRQHLQ